MDITDRQQEILNAIIKEYIRDAQPVGSKTLAEHYDFGIGPAMIRQEMSALEKAGYIVQPHTSAGRIPTDQAYRLYISSIEGTKEESRLTQKDQGKIQEGLRHASHGRDRRELLSELSRVVAEVSGELSVAGFEGGKTRYIHGFSQLAQVPELRDPQGMNNLLRFMDMMDMYFEQIWSRGHKGSFGILIGDENPIKEVRSFSVITGRYFLPEGAAAFVSIIGPKRMDYEKNVALVRYVRGVLEEV